MGIYIAAIILIFFVLLAWFAGSFLHLQGASLWILRCGLILIGLTAAGYFLWFYRRIQRRQGMASQPPVGLEQISVLLKQADQKLRKSKQRSLRSFPIVFIIGESNTAKTSTILNAGLEPELLAGHVFRDSDVVATAAINVWFAKDTVFIEAGGTLISNQQMWISLLRRTTPGRFSAALGKGHQAPRAVVVCFSCERLGATQNSAQNIGSRLKEMAQSLGAAFPIYVLFTKLDLLSPCFTDFVANFTSDEAAQILGATLPRTRTEGVFAEEESKRLAKAFDQIIYSLAEKRLDYLGREAVAEKRPVIYEFSRELGKFRNQTILWLVEMSRPTQLNINPFLRGFYFSGVRPVVINEAVSMAANAPNPVAVGSGATRMFNLADKEALSQAAPQQSVRSRRVPEWTFLPHLFTDVVLRDGVAFSSSHQSRRVDTLRALLLLSAALIFLALGAALVISFLNNRGLQGQVEQAAKGLRDGPQTSGVPTLEGLRQLDQLRATIAELTRYKDEGAPLSYRFGLYSGDSIYSSARILYFTQFQRMLLNATQARIVSKLKRLPDIAGDSDEFEEPYKSLKAYLITTDFPGKSTQEFLSPVLFDRWLEGQSVDPERAKLARTQFDFYSNELRRGIPITTSADAEAVKHARGYLTSGGFENVYRRILFAVGSNGRPINFNRMYPNAQVVDNYEVPAAFTKDGFKAMQEVIRNPEKFFQGEEWVLGSGAGLGLSADTLKQQLPIRYTNDFLAQWTRFIKAASIVRYASLQDAAGKLQALSGNASPLLQLFTLVAQNTSVDSQAIASVLQPPQFMAGKPEQLVGGTNQAYVQALLQLQTSVATLAATYPNGTTDPAATQPVQQTANSAHGAVGQIAQSFHVDNEGRVDAQVRKLMEDPILYTEALVRAIGPGTLSAAGKAFCSQFQVLARKYPFNPKGDEEATLEDLKFFQPGSGALWVFYDANLKNILLRQGSQFIQNPSSPMRISPQFISFLDRAAAISDALFPSGPTGTARLVYTLTQPVNKGIDKLSLDIDGRILIGSGGNSQQFVWPSEGVQGLRLTASYSGSSPLGLRNYSGRWGIFHLLQEAEWKSKGSVYEIALPVKVGEQQITLQDGTPLYVRYEIDANGAQFFRNLQGLHCPPLGAH
jgi:type VI secretion system protein ImpL